MGPRVQHHPHGADTHVGLSQKPVLDVFICYRRGDSAAHAGRLADALTDRFGANSVFMDVDTIEPGVDFMEEIDRAVGHCDVLIALIGPNWLGAADSKGRRLDNPHDLVRLEIEAALERNIRVIPALVGGAGMPNPEELPDKLAGLARRNAVELSDRRFRTDAQLLFATLDKIAAQKPVPAGAGLAPLSVSARQTQPRPMRLEAPPVKQEGDSAERLDYPPVAPQLETDNSYGQSQAFSFGIPSGWRELSPDELREVSTSIGTEALGGITTPASEAYPTNIAVFAGFLASGPDFLSQPAHAIATREQATGLALGAGPYRIAIGDRHAVLFYLRGTAPGQLYGREGPAVVVSGEVWTVLGNRVYSVVMSGPYDRYQTYLPAFYTVLGTWVWT
jgi:hypothetical protein